MTAQITTLERNNRDPHVWVYQGLEGGKMGEVRRYDHPDGRKEVVPCFQRDNGTFMPGIPSGLHPLYGLYLLAKASPTEPVYIVEGEKCATALQSLGLLAITSLGGSNAATKAEWTPLDSRKKVYILPDNDEPGEKYAKDVGTCLRSLSNPPAVFISRLPDLPNKGDAVDWLQARLPAWDGYSPIPAKDGEPLADKLRQTIEGSAEPAPDPAEWEKPIPIDAAALPPWPEDVFPKPFRDFTLAVSESTETPAELAASLALALAATAVQGKYTVQVKADYAEPLNLWTVCVLPPGSRKTAVLEAVKDPLCKWETEKRQNVESERPKIESLRKTKEDLIRKMRQDAAKKKQRREFDQLATEIADIEVSLPEIPKPPRLWAGNVTPEELAALMADNNGRMAILCDEAGDFFAIMNGRYSQSVSSLDIYLQSHSGSSVRVDRRSRAPIFLDHPVLSMGLAIQPKILHNLAEHRENRGRGMLGRFLYFVPRSNLGFRSGDNVPVEPQIRRVWENTVETLLRLAPATNEGGKSVPHRLTMMLEARTAGKEFWDRVERAMRPGGELEYIPDWAAKLQGQVIRIAGVLHCVRYAPKKPENYSISLDDMKAAIRIAEVLIRHALKAFDMMEADPAREGARAILNWIKQEGLATFSKRDCHHRFEFKFKRAEDLTAPLQILQERHYIRPLQPPRGKQGRPSEIFEVNPGITALEEYKL